MTRVSLVLTLVLTSFACATRSQTPAGYDALIQQGNTQLQAGKPDQALEVGQQAIKINPDRWQAYALTGGALMNLKRYEDAADQFSEGIRLAPETKKAQLRDLRKQCVIAEVGIAPSAAAANQSSATPPATTTTQAEVVLWKSIESSQNQSDFEGYLHEYPNGAFAPIARTRLQDLQMEEARRNRQREQDDEQRQKQSQEIWNRGTSLQIRYRHGDNMFTSDWKPAMLTLTPQQISLSETGKHAKSLFSATCAEIIWIDGTGADDHIVFVKMKSTNLHWPLSDALGGPSKASIVSALARACYVF